MSITFWNTSNPAVYDEEYNQTGGGQEINLSNSNAMELMYWIGFPVVDYGGEILAKDLEVLCRRRLMVVSAKGVDPEIPQVVDANILFVGREPGYLTGRTHQLLEIAQARLSDSDMVAWG